MSAPRSAPVLLAALLMLPAAADAQTIHGRVVDLASGTPVPGAEVILSDSAEVIGRALSGDDGHFVLNDARPGRLSLQVRALGYAGAADRDIRYDGQPLFLEIGLRPAPSRDLRVIVSFGDTLRVIDNGNLRLTRRTAFRRDCDGAIVGRTASATGTVPVQLSI